MATKLQLITELSLRILQNITRDHINWTLFLKTGAWNYKYPFQDQLLIYAQYPGATACAPIELWNQKLGRWVNKGARGIALIDDSGSRLRLRHVFDVSDTNSRQNRQVELWAMRDEYAEAVTETLENTFGELEDKSNLFAALSCTANNAVDDNYPDYFSDLMNCWNDSLLEELDVLNAETLFKGVLKSSVAYMALIRCGYAGDEYLHFENFQDVVKFNTSDTVSHLGAAVSDISEMLLREIEATVKDLQKSERQQIGIFANNRDKAHNLSVKQNDEGNGGHGTDLHDSGRLPDTGPDAAGGGNTHRQVWDVAQNIPEKSSERDIRRTDVGGELGQPPVGDRPDSKGAHGENHGEALVDKSRAGQRARFAGLGGTHEQPQTSSGGDSTGGADLQLTLFPTLQQQMEAIEQTEDVNSSVFSISQEILNPVLSPRELYRKYLSEIISRIKIDEIYPLLRDKETGPNIAKQEMDGAIDRIVLAMREEHAEFYEAYTTLPQFREWLVEDVFQRTYQDYMTEKKDIPALMADDPDAPEWVREQVNFRITDDELGHGGAKSKYVRNVAAIRLLNELEEENRLAGPEEQKILSRYVGWGGLPQAFDESNPSWKKEYTELKSLLDEDEYKSARASTLNAHYTSPTVIKGMYACLANMGFKSGNILEPACGVGNFFGLLPESMKNSKLYGVELDNITGRIAKQLYQQANIAVRGFEETNLPDSFFDLAIGNVPFGSYGVADKKYDKHKFYIHDYFFAKTLDKVRPGGIIAFVTYKGTMDKQNPEVRKYIAQRAELLGAVRLPNNAFSANAGTEVTTDILFLQKRDRVMDINPDWIHLSTTGEGVPVNSYFAENPEMMLGTMAFDDRMYGNKNETTCNPYEDADLADLLQEVLENIHAEITEYELDDISDEDTSIPSDPGVRNFSFCLVDGEIYYRENSRMNRVETSVTAAGRIKGMIAIRDCVRELIEYQTEDYSDEVIHEQQRKLNSLYDDFTAQYGLLNSRGNSMAFSDDSSYCLLCSLEILDEDANLERKADMFTKRTIRQRTVITQVDTATEALAISIAEKAGVDMSFMQSLTGLSEEQLVQDLEGVIFRNPKDGVIQYETADAYLSGNVREKLKTARQFAEIHPEIYGVNVTALEKVQPIDLTASEIDVRLGATWLPPDVVRDFMFELLETPYMYRRYIDVLYSGYTANWNVKGKNDDRSDSIKANVTYGTNRINAYKIIEETLNLKDVRIFDIVYEDNTEKRVLNKKETAIAQQKQEAVKEAFQSWIWKDPKRRERLTRLYNDRFNSIRPREYDGSHIRFTGMNPEISLRKHQVDAVAHVLYGGNTLLAHCVGAGKTYEMTAAAMESKHLGLCSKSLFVVPNHLTEQWAGEFLQLYPSANILVATKKDFETKNRKKFCARIATGDYDAVIIGHSQFEKIPISQERQRMQCEQQIAEITSGIREMKEERGERYAIKQLEKTKKNLELKLKKLNDTSRKDDVVTFEELGVDRMFVDEADFYKNLFLYTKMRNVAGLSQTEAQKSSDLFAKCRYLDELTSGRGIIFATGTPISNSITEMYTMQRYLQYATLRKNGLQHFDCWASTFGETVTAIELAPEGTGYRAKTRFARFYNLPELMNMFKEIADIKTADMLGLPVPKANYHNLAVKPSQFQQDMVSELAERAEKVRARMVEPYEDNMLKITNDGRKLALDQRLANPLLPDHEDSKVNACIENIYHFWQDNREKKLTQLVFCDLSTPKNDGTFNVYDDIRQKLIERGVPADEVAFIHEANTETRKKELFAKVRKGQVRIMLGSTFKMGAGTNVQDKLIVLHDLDCPWWPRDLEQRSGRIVRQGNKNDEVHIFRYVTENTFDAYLYQILENKQRFISQVMTSKSPVRSAEDIDETALSYAEVKALATGNPYIKEKMDLDIQVSRLKLLKANHLSQRYALEDKLLKHYPQQIKFAEERIAKYEKDIALYERHASLSIESTIDDGKFIGMTVKGTHYDEKAQAGAAILEACKLMVTPETHELGSYMGFPMLLSFDSFAKQYQIILRGAVSHTVSLGTDIHGNIIRLNNVFAEMPKKLEYCREQLNTLHHQTETAKEQIDTPFEKEEELQIKSARLTELNILLNMDKRENEMVDGEPDDDMNISEKKAVGQER